MMSHFIVYTPVFSDVGHNWGDHNRITIINAFIDKCFDVMADYTRPTYNYVREHLPELRAFIPDIANFDEEGITNWEAVSDQEANEEFAHHPCYVILQVAGNYKAAYEQPARDWWLRLNRELIQKREPTFVLQIIFSDYRFIEWIIP